MANVYLCGTPLGDADCSVLCDTGLAIRASSLMVDILRDDFRHRDSLCLETSKWCMARSGEIEVSYECIVA